MSLTVLIPALDPSETLLEVAGALSVREKVKRIIVVNDGSSAAHESVFQRVAAVPKVVLLRHPHNLGKGAALRTGMRYFLGASGPDGRGTLVTADADGQHLPEDILKVAAAGEEAPATLVLGTRTFARDVPVRSKFGNRLTHLVFRLLVGGNIQDTQTGLRAIPRSLIPSLLRIRAARYEFELEMLVLAVQQHVALHSVPIQTVYIDHNKSSHFRPLLDSVRIYLVFVRLISLSLLTMVIDCLAFAAAFKLTRSIGWGIAAGKLASGIANISVNRGNLARSGTPLPKGIASHALRAAVMGVIAYIAVSALAGRWNWGAVSAKWFVEAVLLLGSFALRRDLVVAKRPMVRAEELAPAWDDYVKKPHSA